MSDSITERDGDIIAKALAYAIEAIDRLPEAWQEAEASDRDHMLMLLQHFARPAQVAGDFRMTARAKLSRRGLRFENGELVLAPREPATVVPLR